MPEPVNDSDLDAILAAGAAAPSPANSQPWEFIVITGKDAKIKIHDEALRCRNFLFEKSGWKWLTKYDLEFVKDVPAIIAVTGDPKKTGADMFMDGGNNAWRDACSASVQNMMLAAAALGLGSLWFTMFDRNNLRSLLNIDNEKIPTALVFIGRSSADLVITPRKDIKEITRYIK